MAAKTVGFIMQPLRGGLGRRRPLKRRVCARSSGLRSPDPRLGGQGNSNRRERHSGDRGFPRSANHHSPPRPQLPPSRKGRFEWDAEYVRISWAVTRRPCAASPGAIAFAGGEAPRRYCSRASGAAFRLLPTRASTGIVLIQRTEIRRHRGEWPPTRPVAQVRSGDPADLRLACKLASASVWSGSPGMARA